MGKFMELEENGEIRWNLSEIKTICKKLAENGNPRKLKKIKGKLK